MLIVLNVKLGLFYLIHLKQFLTTKVLSFRIRDTLQILLQGIILKPLKMPMAKLYLLSWMEPRRVDHPIRAGVGDVYVYHQLVNKLLKFANIPLTFQELGASNYKICGAHVKAYVTLLDFCSFAQFSKYFWYIQIFLRLLILKSIR